MPRRALIWMLTLPLVGTSVLVGHALAYAATGTDPGAMHGYLDHIPQVVALLLLVALLGLATEQRGASELRTLPYLGLVVFSLQEHLERYVHSGHVPFLLADRTFLLGLALQIPVAVVIARLARRVVRDLATTRTSRRLRPRLWILPVLLPPASATVPRTSSAQRTSPSRGPPPRCLHAAR